MTTNSLEADYDIVLIAGSEELKISAQRKTLSAVSAYFRAMFSSTMLETTLKEIKMPGVCGSALTTLIKYIYTGSVEVTEHNVIELLKTADMLLMAEVVTLCESFLIGEMNASNCFEFAHFAEQHHCEILLPKARSYCLEHFMDASESDEFLNLSLEALSALLASNELCVAAEEDVFKSLMNWIRHNEIARTEHLIGLLKLIRLPLLESKFLMDYIKPICPHISMDDGKSIEPRNCFFVMIAISLNVELKKLHIHYYCPRTYKWSKWLKDLELRKNFGTAVMADNLYIVGGQDEYDNALNSVICLNLKTMRCIDINPMLEQRVSCGVAVFNNFLYAIGGKNLNSVEKWNPITKIWTHVAALNTYRYNFATAILNGKLFVIGGVSNSFYQRSVEYYDAVRNLWIQVDPISRCTQLPGVAVVNDLLYVVGGLDGKTMECYNSETNKWTMLTNLRAKLYGTQSLTTFRNKAVACYRDHIEEYDAATDSWLASPTLNKINKIYRLIAYSDKLLRTEFAAIIN